MIGTVLFCVLRPLSCYLTSLFTGALSGIPSPSLVNGKKVWDGGAVPTLGLNQCQKTSLDQQSSAVKAKTEESGCEREDQDSTASGEEEPSADLIDEAVAARIDEPPPVKEDEGESRNDHQQDNLEEPKLDIGQVVGQNLPKLTHNKEGGCIASAGGVSIEQELGLLLKCMHMDGRTGGESTITVQEAVTAASLRVEMQEQVHVPRVEKLTLASARGDETVCWDDHTVLPGAEEMKGERSQQTDICSRFDIQAQQNDTQVNWHFPAGPGLTDEVQCPLWPLPPMSYYPVLEQRGPCEVWRLWEESGKRAHAAELTPVPFPSAESSMDFTVMSYNILADNLLMANLELYAHCPPEVLDWSHRSTLVLEEILKWAPDIVCLQEVQENHYHDYFYPALSQRGYACEYKQRTGSKTDGCATCYRTSRFSQVSVTPLEYFRPDASVLDRHNVGIVMLLRPLVTCGSKVTAAGPLLCVANTHLLFNPKRGDVKLAQLAIMLAEIDKAVKSCQANGELCNLILCGDFNSVPHSPLYELITTGELYFQDLPAWTVSGQEDLSHRVHCHRLWAPLWPSCLGISHNCQYQTLDGTFRSRSQTPDAGKRRYAHHFLLQLRFTPAACVRPVDLELIPGVTDITPDAARDFHQHLYNKSFGHSLYHGLDLESVYQHIIPGSATPEVTTLHSQVGATVDYIFYKPKRTPTADEKAASTVTRTGLRLIGSLALLSEDVLWSLKGLPNHTFPSDHLSLLAKFQMDLNAA